VGYFKAKKDFEFAEEFKDDVKEFWRLEDEAAPHANYGFRIVIPAQRQQAIQRAAGALPGYQDIREKVSQGIVRMVRLSRTVGLKLEVTSMPAPAVGGAIIPQNILLAIIADSTYSGIERQMIIDSINQTTGLLKDERDKQWRRLVNPFHWIKVVFLFGLRLPYNLIKLSGFNVSKFEEHFWGKFLQLLWILSLLGILLLLGIERSQIGQILIDKYLK
jgi:hypothetical protein